MKASSRWVGVIAAVLLAVAAAFRSAARAQDAAPPPPVNAGTDSAVDLRAPAPRDGFSFVVFGDRTGGKPGGVRILERGVEMANRLDPDFVMTVGDLVQGYTTGDNWLAQAREYKAAMAKLAAPWYPVAGNHDVYGGKANPAGNADLFRQQFGPLWYSFGHRWAHVVCLFSDEALSFDDPATDQNLSDAQFEWLAKDLAATKAEQVFVFLHHPRWLYEGTNWPKVHDLLAKDGRVRAVLSGHLHTYRDDGVRDGIHYYTLAMTGAESASPLTETAAVQHIAHVRVRRDRFTMALLPVGSVQGADVVLGAELDAMNELVRDPWLEAAGPVLMGAEAGRASIVHAVVRNPTDRALEYTIVPKLPERWTVAPASATGTVRPGDVANVAFSLITPAWDRSGARPQALLDGTVVYATASGLRQPIRSTAEITVKQSVKSSTAAKPAMNKVLVLDGKSAVRVPLDADATRLAAFTLECWARSPGSKDAMTIAGRTQVGSFSINWNDMDRGRSAPAAFVHLPRMPGTKKAGYVRLFGKDALPVDRWTHVALVHDGAKARLYADGRQIDEQDATGQVTTNSYAFFIGAEPGRWPDFERPFTGQVDEVRLSKVARYTADFKPARTFERDAETVLLFHFDTFDDGLFLDDSGNDDHGWPAGAPRIETGRR